MLFLTYTFLARVPLSSAAIHVCISAFPPAANFTFDTQQGPHIFDLHTSYEKNERLARKRITVTICHSQDINVARYFFEVFTTFRQTIARFLVDQLIFSLLAKGLICQFSWTNDDTWVTKTFQRTSVRTWFPIFNT